MSEFFQIPPQLTNQYENDRVLRDYLQWKFPQDLLHTIEPDLQRMGERAISDIYELGKNAEANPPRHIPYDPWGNRIDAIEVSLAWKRLDEIAAEEKLIALGYERRYGAFSRTYQFAKLYLFHPSSAIYTCPLAMTDGAARAIELYGDETMKQGAFQHLTSSDPSEFWTSGQWMTERTGGSDVSGTSTIAKAEGERYRLYGVKWFTSATTSQMAMTLARIEGAPAGSQGLSLFYIELRDQEGKLNGIRINRLKDKLGTKALPTAELTLDGALASLVGNPGNGVKKIASLFNITRIYNACSAVGYMRRALALSRDYSFKRKAFGRYLCEHELHLETLADMQVEFEAGFHLVFHCIELLGKEELSEATKDESAILRLLTPLVKLYTAKQAIAVVSEALESFGGAGYVEDTGLPQLLRDAQVLSIWEGTTNILSLDALRAIHKEKAAEPFLQDIAERLERVQNDNLGVAKEKTKTSLNQLRDYLQRLSQMNDGEQQIAARRFAFRMTEAYAASLLLEQAEWSLQQGKGPQASVAAERWCSKTMMPLLEPSDSHRAGARSLGLDI